MNDERKEQLTAIFNTTASIYFDLAAEIQSMESMPQALALMRRVVSMVFNKAGEDAPIQVLTQLKDLENTPGMTPQSYAHFLRGYGQLYRDIAKLNQ